MDQYAFITTAYLVSGCLIAALCLASWARSRRVRQQLDRHSHL